LAVTIQQIADACGLAKSTVKNILSSQGGAYSEQTRQRVLEAAKRCGYEPSRLGRHFRSRRLPAVGVLAPELTDPFAAELLDGLTRRLAAMDLEVMVGLPLDSSAGATGERLRSFLSWRLGGLVIVGYGPEAIGREDLERAMGSTAVVTVADEAWPSCSTVHGDRQAAARLAVEHLQTLGHQRIGLLADDNEKTRLVREELERVGSELGDRDIVGKADADADGWFDLGKRFAVAPDRPSAVFAWSPPAAGRFAAGFLAEGGRIPADLSIVVHSRTRTDEAAGLPLTAAGAPVDRLAEATVDLLQRAMAAQKADGPFAEQVRVEPELIVRRSSGRSPVQVPAEPPTARPEPRTEKIRSLLAAQWTDKQRKRE